MSSLSHTQIVSYEPSPHLNRPRKARVCDWAVEGKGGTGDSKVGVGREKKRMRGGKRENGGRGGRNQDVRSA